MEFIRVYCYLTTVRKNKLMKGINFKTSASKILIFSFLGLFIFSQLSFGQDFAWKVFRKENIAQEPFKTGNTAPWSQSTISTFNGYQYVSYYTISEEHCAARRKLPDGNWEYFCFDDYTFTSKLLDGDGHNNTVLGISPDDGTIHIAFDHHVNPLHYRVSNKNAALNPENTNWEPALFSEVTSVLGKKDVTSVTYPRFFKTPSGGLQLVYRSAGSGNGKSHLHEYTADSGWKYIGQFITSQGFWADPNHDYTSNSRNAYFNGLTYDHNGRLHATWCWRESASHNTSNNHDLMYVYSDDLGRTWRNNAGTQVGETGSTQIGVNTEGITVWNISRGRSYINQCTQAVDSEGRIHVVSIFMPPDGPDGEGYSDPNSEYYHFVRMNDGEWKMNATGFKRDRRPKLVIDKHDNAFLLVKHTRVIAATAISGWTDWSEVFSDEVGSGDPTVDYSRWEEDGILSIWAHELRAADYKITDSATSISPESKPRGLLKVTPETVYKY